MCLTRRKSANTQWPRNGQEKYKSCDNGTDSEAYCEIVQLKSTNSTVRSVHPVNCAAESSPNSPPTNHRLLSPPSSYIWLSFANLIPLTVLIMLYFILLLPAIGFVAAASTPWSNACGIYDSADEQHSYKAIHGVQKERIICELRGNLTKQIQSLRRYLGPSNFSKVWAKHNKSYAFLEVARRRNIALRTWHKQLQVYVAAADHLYERAYDYKILQQTAWISSQEQTNKTEGGLTRLRHLIITARGILCELEVTTNLLTNPHLRNQTLAIDSVVMNERLLQLRSDKRSIEEGVDPIDVNMLYHRLRRSLLNMRKALKSRCAKKKHERKQQKTKGA